MPIPKHFRQPTMRLFRQERLGDWPPVFERIAEELARLVAGQREALVPKRTAVAEPVHAPVSPGDLIDRLTILDIKLERITDRAKRAHVQTEYDVLEATCRGSLGGSEHLDALTADLRRVNEKLWEIENAIRQCEREKDFGPEFIDLARSVYRTNDRRSSLKRQINELLGSHLIEEKSYARYE